MLTHSLALRAFIFYAIPTDLLARIARFTKSRFAMTKTSFASDTPTTAKAEQ